MERSRRRGFTLIELVLVLAVGLGLVVGGIALFNHADTKRQVTDNQRSIQIVITEMRRIKGGKRVYEEITTPAAVIDGVNYAAVPLGDGDKKNSLILLSSISPEMISDWILVPNESGMYAEVPRLGTKACRQLAQSITAGQPGYGPYSMGLDHMCDSGTLIILFK